jgi:hypothetical protein
MLVHNIGRAGVRGMTDSSWYQFLAARPVVTEVNFWQPNGGRGFHVLSPGEPFFFKTHYPHNRVVGGGFFSDSATPKQKKSSDCPNGGSTGPVVSSWNGTSTRSSKRDSAAARG